jgi:O-antigen ligase
VFVATNGVGSSGILVIFAFIAWFEPELRNRWWNVIWPFLLVISIYFILMTFYAFSKLTSLRDGVEVLKGVALSLVGLYLLELSESKLRRATSLVVSILCLVTMGIVIFNLSQYGIVQFLHDQGFDWYVNRNRLAVAFSVTAVFTTALMVTEKSRLMTMLWSICWLVLAFAAILNGSRGAMLGMGAATMCIILASLNHMGWKKTFRLELWFLPGLIGFVANGWIFYNHILLDRFFIHNAAGIDTGRFAIWKVVSDRVIQSPWIGYGPHAMKFDPMLAPIRNAFSVDHPHSIYLGLVYASGIVGVLFWLIWFTIFSYKIKQKFAIKNDLAFYFGIGLLVNILVHGLVDFDLYMYSVFTYITIGLVMMLSSIHDKGIKI